ncbi:MAG: hypothetical protein IPL46_15180 [Saprospiraceae bacterium]|nr:hypothetical protein [Saprospiraceae bacterium]
MTYMPGRVSIRKEREFNTVCARTMESKIPEIEEFEIALSTLTRTTPLEIMEFDAIEIYQDQENRLPNGQTITQPAKYLYYRKDNKIKLSSIISKIQQIQVQQKQETNEKIVQAILYCYCFVPRRNDAVLKLNLFLSWNTKADLNQFIVYPFKNYLNYNLKIEAFQMTTFEHLKFKRYCEKFGTDFFELYGRRLMDNLCIKRNFISINLINLTKLTDLNAIYDSELNEAFGLYFEELSKYYFVEFKYDFSKNQNLMTFLNQDYIDIYELSKLHPWQLSIFLNFGPKRKDGWIIPYHFDTMIFDFAGSDLKYEKLKQQLSEKYGDSIINNMGQNETIAKFLDFSAEARRHIRNERRNEGFFTLCNCS